VYDITTMTYVSYNLRMWCPSAL